MDTPPSNRPTKKIEVGYVGDNGYADQVTLRVPLYRYTAFKDDLRWELAQALSKAKRVSLLYLLCLPIEVLEYYDQEVGIPWDDVTMDQIYDKEAVIWFAAVEDDYQDSVLGWITNHQVPDPLLQEQLNDVVVPYAERGLSTDRSKFYRGLYKAVNKVLATAQEEELRSKKVSQQQSSSEEEVPRKDDKSTLRRRGQYTSSSSSEAEEPLPRKTSTSISPSREDKAPVITVTYIDPATEKPASIVVNVHKYQQPSSVLDTLAYQLSTETDLPELYFLLLPVESSGRVTRHLDPLPQKITLGSVTDTPASILQWLDRRKDTIDSSFHSNVRQIRNKLKNLVTPRRFHKFLLELANTNTLYFYYIYPGGGKKKVLSAPGDIYDNAYEDGLRRAEYLNESVEGLCATYFLLLPPRDGTKRIELEFTYTEVVSNLQGLLQLNLPKNARSRLSLVSKILSEVKEQDFTKLNIILLQIAKCAEVVYPY
jgi:hypothetical protein